jgi:hypothetical protein
MLRVSEVPLALVLLKLKLQKKKIWMNLALSARGSRIGIILDGSCVVLASVINTDAVNVF